jgi:hypothetical protein
MAPDHPDVLTDCDLRIHLARQIDLKGGVDAGQPGNHGVNKDVVRVARRAYLELSIAVSPAIDPLRAEQGGCDALARIDGLLAVRYHIRLDQIDDAIAQGTRVQAQISLGG